MKLRGYQQWLRDEGLNALRRVKAVLLVLATGGGKTVIFSSILDHFRKDETVAIAHRKELVSQMSVTLARNDIPHRIIAPPAVVKSCCHAQYLLTGRSTFNDSAKCGVSSVDTLIRRHDDRTLITWFNRVKLMVVDEAHHLLRENKWGKAYDMFPNALLLGVTATPCRADGKGLGRHAHGFFDKMIVGRSMRELIQDGYLTRYKVYAPPSDINLAGLKVGTTGDYSSKELRKRIQQSHIVGDIVATYIKLANNQRGVTFVPDVETAVEVAGKFQSAGIPAKALSANTKATERDQAIKDLEDGKLLMIVNVDLLGEGFDLPAIVYCAMARKTNSLSLFFQQFGRALRPLPGKEFAIIVDHVGNVIRHGLPDKEIEWTLDAREPRSARPKDILPVRVCGECTGVFESWGVQCPYCGAYPEPPERTSPKFVEGDLTEMDEYTLAKLRGDVDEANRLKLPYNSHRGIVNTLERHHQNRMLWVDNLKLGIDQWAGQQTVSGLSISEAYRRFYLNYGVDAISAAGLPTDKLKKLTVEISNDLYHRTNAIN